MDKNRRYGRWLSVLLAVMMVVTYMPAFAFAGADESPADPVYTDDSVPGDDVQNDAAADQTDGEDTDAGDESMAGANDDIESTDPVYADDSDIVDDVQDEEVDETDEGDQAEEPDASDVKRGLREGGGEDEFAEYRFDPLAGDILYSDFDGDLKFSVNDPDAIVNVGDNYSLQVGVLSDTPEDPDNRWRVEFSDSVEYQTPDDIVSPYFTITLSGSKVAQNGMVRDGDRITFCMTVRNGQAVRWYAEGECEFREAKEEYYYEPERDILPGWDGDIGEGFVRVRVENSENPYGWEDDCRITRVEVKEGEDLLQEVPEPEGDGGCWRYKAKDQNTGVSGTVIFRVTYEKLDGSTDSFDYPVNIVSDVFEVDMDCPSGVNQGFPGAEFELEAYGRHMYYDERGDYQEDSDGITYNWELTDGDGFATVYPDENDPSKTVLKFNDAAPWDGWFDERVEVKVSISYDGNEVRENRRDFWLKPEYDIIFPARLDSGLNVGASTDADFEVRHYSMSGTGAEGYNDEHYRTIEDVDYFVTFDENAFTIKDKVSGAELDDSGPLQGNGITITRRGDWGTELHVRAQWQENGEDRDVENHYWFDNKNYDLQFYEHDIDLFTDSGSFETFLDTRALGADYKEYFDIAFRVGTWEGNDEGGEWISTLTEGSDYIISDTEEEGIIRVALTDSFVSTVKNHEDIRVEATLLGKGTQNKLRDTDCWFHLKEAQIEYYYETERDILPGWDGDIREDFVRVHVENSEHPDGWDDDCRITRVEVKEGEDLLQEFRELDGDGEGWYYRAKDQNTGVSGTVIFRVTYEKLDGSTDSFDYPVKIVSDVFEVDMDCPSGVNQGFPGAEFELEAYGRHMYYDKRGDYQEDSNGITYNWELTDGDGFATVEPDNNDRSKAVLKFNDAAPRDGWFDERVEVKVSISYGGNEVRENRRDFWLKPEYDIILPARLDSELNVGASTDADFEVRHYSMSGTPEEGYNEDHYRTIDDATYFVYFDENAFTIKDKESGEELHDQDQLQGSSITITRHGDWGTELHVRAEWQEDGEDRDIESNYWFDDKNYDIWFMQDHGRVFDDGSREFVVNTDNLGDNWADDFELRFDLVGHKGESEFTLGPEYYTIDGAKVILNGEALCDAEVEGVSIRAELWPKDGTAPMPGQKAEAWCEVWRSYTMYEGIQDETEILKGRNWIIPVHPYGEIHNNANPDGYLVDCEVTNVEVISGEGLLEITRPEDDAEDPVWDITARDYGPATVKITLKYTNESGDEVIDEPEMTFHISDSIYWVNIESKDNVTRGLPGHTIELKASTVHEWINGAGEREVSTEGFTYGDWEVIGGDKALADIEVSGEDNSTAVVTLKAPEGRQDFWEDFDIGVKAYDDGDQVGEARFVLSVASFYFQISPTSLDEDFDENDRMEVDLKLLAVDQSTEGEPREAGIPVQYRVFYQDNVEILDSEDHLIQHGELIGDDNHFVIHRMSDRRFSIGIRAEEEGTTVDEQGRVDGHILDFVEYNFGDALDTKVKAAETAADDAKTKAGDAAAAVEALERAAKAAKDAADKAAKTLNAQDIADAEAKTVAAEQKQKEAQAAIDAAEEARKAAEKAIEKANAAIEAAEADGLEVDDAKAKVSSAEAAANTSDAISQAKAAKETQDNVVSQASSSTKKAASDKAAADKKAAAAKAAETARQGKLNAKLPKLKISKPKAAKKAVTVKWKKLSKKDQKKVQKIEIWVCPNKKFAASDTIIKTAGKKKASLKVKGLKSKKKYYIKIRTIKTVSGVKNVSKWSKVKSIKVK